MTRRNGAGRRWPSARTAVALSLAVNAALGVPGQFALFYPYVVARDVLARLGVGSPGIPFRDGYAGALMIGIPLLAVWAGMLVAVNVVILRRTPVSRRSYWFLAVLVASASATAQLVYHLLC